MADLYRLMFAHVLVPLDGSTLAEDILGSVESLASNFGSRVTLLHVLERAAPTTVHGQRHIAAASEAATYLGEIADRLHGRGVGVDVHVHTRSVDDVAVAVDAHAHEYKADLIAMCKHGRTGLRQRFLGGIAQRILRGGSTPILLRTPREAPSPTPSRLENILVPLDGRHDADTVIDFAIALAKPYGAGVTLLHSVPSLAEARRERAEARFLPRAMTESLQIEEEQVLEFLGGHRKRLEDANVETSVSLRGEEPAHAILAAARDVGAQLIILSTHARAGLEAWYTNSTGFRVITEATQTLLLLREL